MAFNCDVCGSQFQQRRNLLQHQKEHHGGGNLCAISIANSTLVEEMGGMSLHMVERAIRNFVRSYQLRHHEHRTDPEVYLNDGYGLINTLIGNILSEWKHGLKMLLSLRVEFVKAVEENHTITAHFNSNQHVFLNGSEIDKEIRSGFSQIMERIDAFTQKGNFMFFCQLYA